MGGGGGWKEGGKEKEKCGHRKEAQHFRLHYSQLLHSRSKRKSPKHK